MTIDRTVGLVAHLPLNAILKGEADVEFELVEVGLNQAGAAAGLLHELKTLDLSDVFHIATPGAPSPVESPDGGDATHGTAASPPSTLADLRAQVKTWSDADRKALVAYFDRNDTDRNDPEQVAEAMAAVQAFNDVSAEPIPPRNVTNVTKGTTVVTLPTTAPDEGGDADGDTVALLEAKYKALDADGRAWVNAVGAQATKAGLSFAMSDGRRTVRRFEIMRGLIALADGFANDDAIRGCAAAVNAEIADAMSFNLGQVVGHMGADDAALFANLAVALVEGEASMRWTDDRRCRVEVAA
jgi:hypothetical protein